MFLLSGGTTGLPKLIARTHDDYAYNARASARAVRLRRRTRSTWWRCPPAHNFPLACPGILGTLLVGGRVVMLPLAGARAGVRDDRGRGGHASPRSVPAVAQRWLEHADGARRDDLRQPAAAAGRRGPAGRRGRPHGCARCSARTLQQVFGMAEGLLNYTRLDDPEEVVCTTQGRPMSPGDEVRVVDELDQDVPDGEPGSLLTRGPYTPARLLPRRRAERARVHRRRLVPHAATSCAARPDGNLVVEGRDKDMINRGGEKISAEEVENLVYQLPAGAPRSPPSRCPTAELGERVCVYVVPQARHHR